VKEAHRILYKTTAFAANRTLNQVSQRTNISRVKYIYLRLTRCFQLMLVIYQLI